MINRRKVLTILGTGSAVAMTLHARSVMGQNACTLSGMLSGNISSSAGESACTNFVDGLPPKYWLDHPNEWPIIIIGQPITAGTCADVQSFGCVYEDGTLFEQIFFANAIHAYGNTTMYDILRLYENDPYTYEAGAVAVAALFNVVQGTGGGSSDALLAGDIISFYHSFQHDPNLLLPALRTLTGPD